MRIKSIFFLGALLTIQSAIAQTDFETWHAVGLSLDRGKMSYYWDNELRLDNNSSEIRKFQSEGGVDYKLAKRVTISGGYRYSRYNSKGYYKNEHRAIAILKYAPRIQRFVFEFQTRTEYIARPEDGYIRKEEFWWRNKFTINYKWPTQPITLFASYELFTLLSPQMYNDKYRAFLGAKYQFQKNISLTAYWGLQQGTELNADMTYIAGWKLSYTIKQSKKRKNASEVE